MTTEIVVAPRAINHVVLNVRDIEESHRFWTEMIGFKHVGTAKPRPDRPNPPNFRFYSCSHEGRRLSHHDLALVANPNLPPRPAGWNMVGMNMAINHVATLLPSREAWLQHLAYLQSKGVKFDRRVEHGMTHSLYIHDPNGYGIELLYELPRAVQEDDIDGALNYSVSSADRGTGGARRSHGNSSVVLPLMEDPVRVEGSPGDAGTFGCRGQSGRSRYPSLRPGRKKIP